MSNDRFLLSLFDPSPGKPEVMGILNLDSNSFYRTSVVESVDQALKRVEIWYKAGLRLLDLGAFTSRPGAIIPDPVFEWNVLDPYLKELIHSFPDLIFSLDTVHGSTAEKAINLGVEIINDISGGTFDLHMIQIIAQHKKTMIAMHMRGVPATMNLPEHLQYDQLLPDLIKYFANKVYELQEKGINRVIIDPGIGFSKVLTDNYKILSQLELFKIVDAPLLIGMSRKSMFWKLLDTSPEDVLGASLAANTLAMWKGCKIIRVHDVLESLQSALVIRKCFQSIDPN